MPRFSVVLATRDRPGPFADALGSILAQEGASFEIIVVDDGSQEEHRAAYAAALAQAESLGTRLQVHHLVRRPRGHGPAYGRNFGAEQATGEYLCFLDDDDVWTDPAHLRRAAAALEEQPADLYLTNQRIFRDGAPTQETGWLEPLRDAQRAVAARLGRVAAPIGVEALLRTDAFCHMNTFIIRLALYRRLGGMDESLRWEEDRDLYLRAIDTAEAILYGCEFTARHNQPLATAGSSASASLSPPERWLNQLRVLDKAIQFAKHPAIRSHGRRHKAYALKRIAEYYSKNGENFISFFYAREALSAGPTWKWLAFTLRCWIRGLPGR